MACPDGAAIDAYNGDNFCPGPGYKAFIGGIQIIAREEAFCSAQLESLRYFQDAVACHALERTSCGRRGVQLSLPYEEDVVGRAFSHIPFAVEHHGLERSGLLCFQFG
jgi:hypothetical protein